MGTIVLVVADKNATLSAGDVILQDRLIALGHSVVLRSDEESEYSGTYDGVMVSDSCVGATFGSKYDTVAKPGVTLEAASWRLGTTGTTGSNITQWNVQSVLGANGPGLSGTKTVYTSGQAQQGLTAASIPAGGQVVAYEGTGTTKVVYAVYKAGATLTSGTAPARRVFLRIGDTMVSALNATGLSLLDSAITWAFGGTIIDAYITGYGYWDNNPPGSAEISDPVLHSVAGGVGTYSDPITCAVRGFSPNAEWPPGTRFYVPHIQRYVIVEDTIGDDPYPPGITTQLDIWTEGGDSTEQAGSDCQEAFTDEGLTIIKDPPAGLQVLVGPIVANNVCRIPGFVSTGAVQLRNATTDAQANLTTATATKPPGLAAGDLLLAVQTSDLDGTLAAMTAPAGWTQIGAQFQTGVGGMKVWQKIAGASEPSSYAFPDSTGAHGSVVVAAFHGQHADTPIAAGPTFANSGTSSTSHSAPSVTGVSGGMLVTAHVAGTNGTPRTYTPPSGMTEIADITVAADGYIATEVNILSLSTSGATGTKTATPSASTPHISMSLVVAPGAAAFSRKSAGFLQLL